MMAKARDESDAAFDAYFYWLCDGSMSAGNMVGGGGGGYAGGHHVGTMGRGYYDVGFYTMDDLMGSLWNATPNNAWYTFTNANGGWYHTSTSFVYVHYDYGSNKPVDLGGSLPQAKLSALPDMTRNWLAYVATMTNAYHSNGTLDWVHIDAKGIRSTTSYSAMSGASNVKGGFSINAGTWTAYELESSPFTDDSDDDAFYGNDGWGFKVRLEDQFGRTSMLIHPGMHGGTGGCIGLDQNDQLLDFYNRMNDYNLSPNHTLNVYVSYGN